MWEGRQGADVVLMEPGCFLLVLMLLIITQKQNNQDVGGRRGAEEAKQKHALSKRARRDKWNNKNNNLSELLYTAFPTLRLSVNKTYGGAMSGSEMCRSPWAGPLKSH